MSAFCVRHFWEDVTSQLTNCKRKVAVCCVVALLGMVLGIVMFSLSNYNWWYCNRYLFVEKLVYGGFFTVFLRYLLCAALLSVLLCACLLQPFAHPFCYATLFVTSVYFGANCCAIFACAGALLGALYLVVLVFEQAANMLCCFLAACNCACKRTFIEAFRDAKHAVILQFLAIIAKILIIFVLLRIITALI